MEVLKNDFLNSSTFQAMQLTESYLVDSHIADSEERRTPSEHFKVPDMHCLPT